MRKVELEALLKQRLRLQAPLFRLRKIGAKIAGSIVSDTFKRKGDHVRQKMIWDALEAEFGAEAARKVGTILAYTWDEWDVDLPAKAG
jgi:acid stress-induced BolA-like protein IbaG/YrbA